MSTRNPPAAATRGKGHAGASVGEAHGGTHTSAHGRAHARSGNSTGPRA